MLFSAFYYRLFDYIRYFTTFSFFIEKIYEKAVESACIIKFSACFCLLFAVYFTFFDEKGEKNDEKARSKRETAAL